MARPGCADKDDWSCFGSIAMHVSSSSMKSKLSITYFNNGELMAEAIPEGESPKRLLSLRSVRLYAGLDDKEILEGFPFIFFDYGFFHPLIALRSAYPDGVEQVPAKEKQTPVDMQGEKGMLTTTRSSPTRVEYKIRFDAGQISLLEGFWDAATSQSLPNNYSLSGWKSCRLTTFATLAAARASKEDCPARSSSEKK